MAKLALFGGEPACSVDLPPWPQYGEREREELMKVLEDREWGGYSTHQRAFEERFAEYVGAPHTLCCNGGTDALRIAMQAAGVDIGDEVLVPSFTFIASVSSILLLNAVPVYVDVEPDTGNMDVDDARRRITPRTKAIMPVYVGGRPPDMDALVALADEHGLALIEDSCEAAGASWRNRHAGTLGRFGAISLQNSKNFTAGDGGIVIINDPADYERAYACLNVGRTPPWTNPGYHDPPILAGNHRMSAFGSAVLTAALERLDAETDQRHRNGERLRAVLGETGVFRPAPGDERITRDACHFFLMTHDPDAWEGLPRKTLLNALRAEGVPLGQPWATLCHEQPAVVAQADRWRPHLPEMAARLETTRVSLPNSERLARETGVSLRQTAMVLDDAAFEQMLAAFYKVREHADELLKEAKQPHGTA